MSNNYAIYCMSLKSRFYWKGVIDEKSFNESNDISYCWFYLQLIQTNNVSNCGK